MTDTKLCPPRGRRASKMAALARRALARDLAALLLRRALASWLSWLQSVASHRRAYQLVCRQLLPGCTWQQDLVHLRVRFSREQPRARSFSPFFWTCLDFSARYIEELASWITRLPF